MAAPAQFIGVPALPALPGSAVESGDLLEIWRDNKAYKADADWLADFVGSGDFAPLESPHFTGVPLVPTAAPGTNTTQAASTAFVKAATDALVESAPGALDTLNELAAALGDDANFAATMTSALALKAPLASPTFTGTVTIPTPSVDDNTTKAASTAYVIAQASASGDGTPAGMGTAARGTSIHWARADHVHPYPTQPVVTRYTSGSGNHSWTAGVRRARVRMVGPGGGGQGSGSTPGNGANGLAVTSLASWTADVGDGGNNGTGGAGGTGGTDGTGVLIARIAGTRGGDGRAGYTFQAGGLGGGTMLGQAAWNAPSGGDSNASVTGPPNSGVGGSGGAADATAPMGAGGGGGEYVEFYISAPTGTSAYAVGGGGTAGTIGGGTNPRAGSAGQAGIIIIEEYFS